VTSLTLRKTKTDKADSRFLSLILLPVEYKVYPIKSYHIEETKSLTRYYKTLVKKRSKEMVNLTNSLDYVFPEFKSFFNNRFSKTALYILENYQTPERISNMNSRSFDKKYKVSKGHFSYPKFINLKVLSKVSIGSSSDGLNFHRIYFNRFALIFKIIRHYGKTLWKDIIDFLCRFNLEYMLLKTFFYID